MLIIRRFSCCSRFQYDLARTTRIHREELARTVRIHREELERLENRLENEQIKNETRWYGATFTAIIVGWMGWTAYEARK